MPFQEILEELREATGATRTTLRLDTPGENFPCVAEALAPGAPSIKDDTSIDQRNAPTARRLFETLRPLVQNDCLGEEPRPPQGLLDVYGVKAQMLGPVVRGGELVGWVSAHYAPNPRAWSEDDVAALERAVDQVVRELPTGA